MRELLKEKGKVYQVYGTGDTFVERVKIVLINKGGLDLPYRFSDCLATYRDSFT